MDKYICIHGHFYQPPRENPWLEVVELQDEAYPYHDWNERIRAECYAPNAASRILDQDRKIIDIVNNYTKMSFNFGPTLLSWLDRKAPEVYQAVIDADRLSQERFSGHGSALAQAYNHIIMPLANSRDKRTQIIWGIRDFQKRFVRDPEGMWLPETAVDMETLELLAELGIKFTILAPRQAKKVRKIGTEGKWQEVSSGNIDPTMPYLCPLPSGRTISLFFYDGPIAHDVGFGELLKNGEILAKRLLNAFKDERKRPQMVHIATDGETYGHHHRYGDMALAYCLYFIESNNLAKITNYGEYLDKHPPTYEVEIIENSSWSCTHGVERWRDNCGCNSGMHPGWSQAWRKPLREAMDWLRDSLIPHYEAEASKYLKEPWEARDDHIEFMLDRTGNNTNQFFAKHAIQALSKPEKTKVLKLLEMQKNVLLMYTSCGWFFDDISRIETIQVLQYATKAMQTFEELFGSSMEQGYLNILEQGASNVREFKNGSKIYDLLLKPAMIDCLLLGAHYAISSLFEDYPEKVQIYCYTATTINYDRKEAGKLKLAVGQTGIISDITWDEASISFAVLHLGDHNVNGGVKNFMDDEAFSLMNSEISQAFDRGDVAHVIRLMDKHFGMNNYSLWHLFKDEQRKILKQILSSTLDETEFAFRQIYENNYPIMNFLNSLQIPIPKPLSEAADYVINVELKKIFEEEDLDIERLTNLVNEAKKWSVQLDQTTIGYVASSRIHALMESLNQEPEDIDLFAKIINVLKVFKSLAVGLELWEAQNIYFSLEQTLYRPIKEKAEKGDNFGQKWVEAFRQLGAHLNIKI